jgi:hypothetical protein
LVGTTIALTIVKKEIITEQEKEQIMNTKLQTLVNDNDAVVGRSFERVLSDKAYDVSTSLNGEDAVNDSKINKALKKERTLVKTIGLFLATPFIALAYVIALPFIGIYHFAKLALQAYAKRRPPTNGKLKKTAVFVKNIGLFFAAPFVALAYIIALAFVGFFMISKLAMEAKGKRAYTNS